MIVCLFITLFIYKVGKQILAENPLSSSGSYSNNIHAEHAYEGVQLEDHELIVIPTLHSDAANTIAMKGNIVKDYHKMKQTADTQAKAEKDAIAAKLQQQIHEQQYRQYLKQKETEILNSSLEEVQAANNNVANVVAITSPITHPLLHEEDENEGYNEEFEENVKEAYSFV